MTTDREQLDASVAAGLYVRHAVELDRFLVGVLHDRELAKDVLQIAFARLLEQGGKVRPEARKAWLFQVAYREAAAQRRREAVAQRVLRRAADAQPRAGASPEVTTLRRESIAVVRKALECLPAAQREVVRRRIYEEKTFAAIAAELQIPLGTALGRMRAAMRQLRQALRGRE